MGTLVEPFCWWQEHRGSYLREIFALSSMQFRPFLRPAASGRALPQSFPPFTTLPLISTSGVTAVSVMIGWTCYGPWRGARLKGIKAFTVLYRRWVIERSFTWMGRCRRLAKDFELTIEISLAWVKRTTCRFMIRRNANARKADFYCLEPETELSEKILH